MLALMNSCPPRGSTRRRGLWGAAARVRPRRTGCLGCTGFNEECLSSGGAPSLCRTYLLTNCDCSDKHERDESGVHFPEAGGRRRAFALLC